MCQVFMALTTSSTQCLHILMSYFRRFVTKIHSQPRHNSDSRSSAASSCDNVLTCASIAQCSQVTSLLPLHNMHMHTVTANGTPDSDAVLPSTLPSNPSIRSMPTPIVPPTFVSFTPTDVSNSRYKNRPLVYVLCHHIQWIVLRSYEVPEIRLPRTFDFQNSRDTSPTSKCINQVTYECGRRTMQIMPMVDRRLGVLCTSRRRSVSLQIIRWQTRKHSVIDFYGLPNIFSAESVH